MDRRRVLLIAAVVVALLGTTLVFLYVRGADERAAARYDTVEVLRATAVIEPGESIDDAAASGKIALDTVSQADRLPSAQSSTERLSGLVALARIYPGEQIITEKFGQQADASSPLQIPRGMMAISVNLTDPARVAGFVNPGSEIAMFLSGVDPASGQPFTRLLLPRVTVLGVGSTTPSPTTTTEADGSQVTEQLPRTLLTIAVDQEDAQKVLFAVGNGEIAFALLTGQSTVRPDPGANAGNLFR